ncbi:unnamed protein product, partial [Cyprideis torosa]
QAVCQKCGVDTPAKAGVVWLCKLCSEKREIWKKSGAWFFNSLPAYVLPQRDSMGAGGMRYGNGRATSVNRNSSSSTAQKQKPGWIKMNERSSESGTTGTEESSEDEISRRFERINRPPVASSLSAPPPMTGSSFSPSPSAHSISSLSPRFNHASPSPSSPLLSPSASNQLLRSPSRNSTMTEASPSPPTPQNTITSVIESYAITEYKRIESYALIEYKRIESYAMTECKRDTLGPERNVTPSPLHADSSPYLHFNGGAPATNHRVPSPGALGPSPSDDNPTPVANHQSRINSKPVDANDRYRSTSVSADSSEEGGGYGNSYGRSKQLHRILSPPHYVGGRKSVRVLLLLSGVGVVGCFRRVVFDSRGSSSSSFSFDSDNVYCNRSREQQQHRLHKGDVYLGMIELSLHYEASEQTLHANIHRCKGLRATDKSGSADPYVELSLLPGASRGSKYRTQTVHRSLKPSFHETVSIPGVKESHLSRGTLKITVLDADKYGNEALGEVRLPLFKLQPDLTYHYNMFLEPPIAIDRSDSVSSRSTQSSHYGEKSRLLLSLKYSTKRKALIVGVVRCQNLPPMDLNGLADPLIRVRLRPDSLRRDYATETRKGTLNPEFNQEFVFESLINELPRKTLEIGVWHRDIGRKKNFIGERRNTES